MHSYPQKCLLGAIDKLENNFPDFFRVENVRLVRLEQNVFFTNRQSIGMGGVLKTLIKLSLLRKIH